MKSPKQIIEDLYEDVLEKMNKFVKRKYPIVFAFDYTYEGLCLTCSLCFDELFTAEQSNNNPTINITHNNNLHENYYSSVVDFDTNSFIIYSQYREFTPISRSYLKQNYNCDDKIIQSIEFFGRYENITEFCTYVVQCHNLLYNTPYIYALPLAYTFLLCNKKINTFPKDIAKLIGEKILFFKIEIVEIG
jgi:hypothetical protein